MATNKAKKENIFKTTKGLEIEIKSVDPALIQRVMRSTPMPPRPVYEAKTFGGRVEFHPLDEESAAQTPGGQGQWDLYQEQLTEAQTEQNDRVIRALFLYGTDCIVPDDGWVAMHEFLGMNVPTDPEMRRAHYLSSELSAEDLAGVTSAIMKMTGVSEEAIADAEAAFRGAVRDKPEPT